MTINFSSLLAILAVLMVLVVPVRADQSIGPFPGLNCDPADSSVLLRFGSMKSETLDYKSLELPEATDVEAQRLAALPLNEHMKCRLANGQKIEVNYSRGQSFAYGRGGADPDAFFTLKIDGNPVYFEQIFYSGYGKEKFELTAIYYDGKQMRECTATKPENRPSYSEMWPMPALADCSFRNERLLGNGLSAEEQNALGKAKEREKLKHNLSEFCKEFSSEKTLRAIIQGAEEQRQDVIPTGKHRDGGPRSVTHMTIDLNNDGKNDTVLRIADSSGDCISCGTRPFDGSFLISFPINSEKIDDFLATEYANLADIIPENDGKPAYFLPKWDAHTVSIHVGSPRYSYNVPFIKNGITYIYSFETNTKNVPNAQIVKLNSDYSIEKKCAFAKH
jgi:hypothetical protein